MQSFRTWILGLALALILGGCATSERGLSRPFVFGQDSFSFENQLVWEYHFHEDGTMTTERRNPPPEYSLHCFVVARAARQFFQNARFEPSMPRTNELGYRRLVDRVVAIDPQHFVPENKRVVIPGYANLREFSTDYEALLKKESGAWWHSYIQRGHWRIVFPFSRRGQAQAAEKLLQALRLNRPPIVHLVRFPQLSINHGVLLFGATETPEEIKFSIYDPNDSKAPTTLTFDRRTRTFNYPHNGYFVGGAVNVYEVYRSLFF